MLRLLCEQYDPPEFEVIIVNDGGDEKALTEMYAQFKQYAQYEHRLLLTRFFHQANSGAAAARNLGASKALGEIVVFLDDDCHPDQYWLFALKRHYQQYPNCMVGGPMEISPLVYDNLSSVASQLFIRFLHEIFTDVKGGAPYRTKICGGHNMAVSRRLFYEVGQYDRRLNLTAGDDRELWDRWLAAGYEIHYDPSVVVYHRHVMSPKRIWLQFRRYGRGAYQFSKIVAENGRHESPFNTLGFQMESVLYPFACYIQPWSRQFKLACLIAMLQVAYFFGVVEEIGRSKRGL